MFNHTIASYPDRGPWGDNQYRGNCSGHLIVDLIETWKPEAVLDPMQGSGTTGHVCAELGVLYRGYDLRTGTDIMYHASRREIIADSLKLPKKGYDLIFFHPPYWNMVKYGDSPKDFCNGTYEQYLRRMDNALNFLGTLLVPGGRIALLLADLRRGYNHTTYFLTDDVTEHNKVAKAGLVKEIKIIKVQHKTMSHGDTDLPVKFAHEYLTIMRKPIPEDKPGWVE